MATLEKVSKDIVNKLELFSNGVARAVASDLHTISKVRIFDDGLNSAGSKIGEYTQYTISLKKSKGRFSGSSVNLRDTEKLANSYIFDCDKDECKIGFANINRGDGTTNAELMVKLEDQYGDIFKLTSDENAEINNIIGDFLDRMYK